MSLVADYGEYSSDENNEKDNSSESEEEKNSVSEEITPVPKTKLPAPAFFRGTTPTENDDFKSTSVFTNSFIEAEAAKEAVLQKHVKMTETKNNTVVINGKKICWNYRKGRCRFGHKCKFAHDSDLQKTNEELAMEKVKQRQQNTIVGGLGAPSSRVEPSEDEIGEILDESQKKVSQKKRKRPGLSQGLVPGKKVMENYMKLK